MKFLFITFLLITSVSAESVEIIADRVLTELQGLSTAWRSIKDEKSAKVAMKTSKKQVEKLSKLATELQSYQRPDNAKRTAIHKKRAKRVEKISLEMAHTFAILSKDAPLMNYVSSQLNTYNPELEKSQKVFDLYFKPDSLAQPAKK